MAATMKCICAVDLITAIDTGVKCHIIDHFEVTSSPFIGRSELRVSGRAVSMEMRDQHSAQGRSDWENAVRRGTGAAL